MQEYIWTKASGGKSESRRRGKGAKYYSYEHHTEQIKEAEKNLEFLLWTSFIEYILNPRTRKNTFKNIVQHEATSWS